MISGQHRPRKRAAKRSPPLPLQSLTNKERKSSTPPTATAATEASLSWNVQYLGSFAIGRVDAETISRQLDTFIVEEASRQGTSGSVKGRPVQLVVSLAGVSVHAANGDSDGRVEAGQPLLSPLFSHSLRRITCVVGRVEARQIAYISRELAAPPPGSADTKVAIGAEAYRKQCHVFRTPTSFEVEEIEAVLSNAFQRATSPARRRRPTASTSAPRTTNGISHPLPQAVYKQSAPPHATASSTIPTTPKSNSESRSTLFQRLFGSATSSKAALPTARNGGGGGGGDGSTPVRFRQWPTPLPPHPQTPTTIDRTKRTHSASGPKRRPVSAIFQRLTSAAAMSGGQRGRFGQQLKAAWKRDTPNKGTAEAPNDFSTPRRRPLSTPFLSHRQHLAPAATLPTTTTTTKDSPTKCTPTGNEPVEGRRHSLCEKKQPRKAPTLVYDAKLSEWIYPMDEEEFGTLAYFSPALDKNQLMAHLQRMQEGAFVLRVSGSRRRCLALSVRVPDDPEKNTAGISHYLIVRNANGYRIKGSKIFFDTIPMLITHHTVVSEHLPCRLVFSNWDPEVLKGDGKKEEE